MLAHRRAAFEQDQHERGPYSAAARVGANMHRMLNSVTIAAPAAAPVAERGEANDAARIRGDDHRKTAPSAHGQPSAPILKGRGLLHIDGGRVGDDLVVDGEYPRQVDFGCVADFH
jgi:hypothetical protein